MSIEPTKGPPDRRTQKIKRLGESTQGDQAQSEGGLLKLFTRLIRHIFSPIETRYKSYIKNRSSKKRLTNAVLILSLQELNDPLIAGRIRASLPSILKNLTVSELELLKELLFQHVELKNTLTDCFSSSNNIKQGITLAKTFTKILGSSLSRAHNCIQQDRNTFIKEMNSTKKMIAFSQFIQAVETKNIKTLSQKRKDFLTLFDHAESYSISWINALVTQVAPPKHILNIHQLVKQTRKMLGDQHLTKEDAKNLVNVLNRSSQLAANFTFLLNQVEKTYSERPLSVFSPENSKRLIKKYSDDIESLYNKNLILEKEKTLLNNVIVSFIKLSTHSQLHLTRRGLKNIYKPPSEFQNMPYLRETEIPWLFEEQIPALELTKNKDLVIDLDFSTCYALTDFQTQEDKSQKVGDTIVLRTKFPFSGKMTQLEARKLIQFVHQASKHLNNLQDNDKFEKLLIQFGYIKAPSKKQKTTLLDSSGQEVVLSFQPVNNEHSFPKAIVDAALQWGNDLGMDCRNEIPIIKSYMQEKIHNFILDALVVDSRGIANFGPSPDHPQGWVVHKTDEFKAFNADRTHAKKALAAASLGNVFLLNDGSYSLIAEATGMEHLTKLPKTLVEKVKTGLLNEENFTIEQGLVVPGDKIPVAFSIERDDDHFVHLTLTLTIEGNTYSRKRLYKIKEGKTNKETLAEAINSGLIERDLLMAKAQFMQQAQTLSIRGEKEWWNPKNTFVNTLIDAVVQTKYFIPVNSSKILKLRAERDLRRVLNDYDTKKFERFEHLLRNTRYQSYLKEILDNPHLNDLERIQKLNFLFDAMYHSNSLELQTQEPEVMRILSLAAKDPKILVAMHELIVKGIEIKDKKIPYDLKTLITLRNTIEHTLTTSILLSEKEDDKSQIRQFVSRFIIAFHPDKDHQITDLYQNLSTLSKQQPLPDALIASSLTDPTTSLAWQGFVNAALQYQNTKNTTDLFVQLSLLKEVIKDENCLNIAKRIALSLCEEAISQIPQRVDALSGGRFTDQHKKNLQTAVSKDVLVALVCLSYLDVTEEIQDIRPRVFDQVLTGAELEKRYQFIAEYASALYTAKNDQEIKVMIAMQTVNDIQKSLQFGTLTNNLQAVYQTLEYVYNPETHREIPRYDASSTEHQLYWEYSHQLLLWETRDVNAESVMIKRVSEYDIVHPRTLETTRVSVPFPFQGEITKKAARSLLQLMRQTIQDPETFSKNYNNSQLKFEDLSKETQEDIKKNCSKEANLEQFTKKYLKTKILHYKKQVAEVQAHATADFNAHKNLPKRWWVQSTPEMQAFAQDPRDLTAVKAATLLHTFRENNEFFLLPASDLDKNERKRIGGIPENDIKVLSTALAQEETVNHALAVQYVSKENAVEEKTAPLTISLKRDPSRAHLLQMTLKAKVKIEDNEMEVERIKFYSTEKMTSKQEVLDSLMETGQFQHDLVRFKGELMREIAERG
ncbi:MAG: hypothetical protein KDK55_04240 [Chlamydiia bacterium]|nr:hypothetical protein [Chlamydiia bacterium]